LKLFGLPEKDVSLKYKGKRGGLAIWKGEKPSSSPTIVFEELEMYSCTSKDCCAKETATVSKPT